MTDRYPLINSPDIFYYLYVVLKLMRFHPRDDTIMPLVLLGFCLLSKYQQGEDLTEWNKVCLWQLSEYHYKLWVLPFAQERIFLENLIVNQMGRTISMKQF